MRDHTLEPVYAITDYVDGILAGVAGYRGHPHVFVIKRFGSSCDLPVYCLWPLESQEAIGQFTSDIWNPKPELTALIAQSVERSTKGAVHARGNFLPNPQAQAWQTTNEMIVSWEECSVESGT
ncbi:MAG: hypothetical protein K1X48_05055 [Burkholderiaceae bacterium]|nr:hypothetical protein [Burkholderiaceae bacterium]